MTSRTWNKRGGRSCGSNEVIDLCAELAVSIYMVAVVCKNKIMTVVQYPELIAKGREGGRGRESISVESRSSLAVSVPL